MNSLRHPRNEDAPRIYFIFLSEKKKAIRVIPKQSPLAEAEPTGRDFFAPRKKSPGKVRWHAQQQQGLQFASPFFPLLGRSLKMHFLLPPLDPTLAVFC